MATIQHDHGYGDDGRTDVPGTVQLVDLDGTMHTKHAKGSKSDIVLIPAPSSDPDDPLNWSPSRKALSTTCMGIYTLMVGIASAAIYSILEPISAATNLTLGDLNAGTGYMFLAFGWGCLVWQPLAIQYGKRPVYLFSLLATMAIQIWAPYTTSNSQWIANKVLQGFFGAPVESLCEISVTDIYFQHERGFYIALYGLLLAGSNFFAPIIAGFIADGQGWEWVLYWCAIFCGIGLIILFFFLEETNYSRVVQVGTIEAPPSPVSDTVSKEAEKMAREVQDASSPSPSPEPERSTKTYIDKLKLFRTADLRKPTRLLGMVTRPLIFLTFPVIFYSGFCYGSNLVWFNVLNGTSSLILANPPYDFAASMVGLSYFSPLIGTAISSFYTGYLGDRILLQLARRNKGILEPEYRLWLFLPALFILPAGLILWGVGAAHHVHWFGCVFAMGTIAFTNAVGLQIAVAYCIDSYKALASEAIVTVILVRNTMSFAVGYGITPWVTHMGLQDAFLVAAFVGMAQIATFAVFVRCGKGLRRRSARRYAKYVAQMASAGVVH
ncbi:MFS general substrate transporter [Lecanosticta acicola]|uniref:MFS general substrate transporter n=1 Tax=Lecanosticta acicola TaxID=111012 RepID=A0AAI8Z223_9PEZI|nr:MFS general substrate transporter [Lecanosticta acicola]